MKMNGMELTDALRRNYVTSPYFGGVVSADRVPQFRQSMTRYFIVNADTSLLPGSHWLVIFIGRVPEFFDSFGRSPSTFYKDIEDCLINNGPQYLYNTCQFQSLETNYCGLYCLYYIFKKCVGLSMMDIANTLDAVNFYANDVLVKEFCASQFTVQTDI